MQKKCYPQYPENQTWAQYKTETINYTSTATSITRYVRSNVEGSSLNVASVSCGSSTNPGTCTGTLAANA